MAQPTNRILTPKDIENSDYRRQWVESVTDATDFGSADSSLILSTIPFLPIGDSFTEYPLFPVGVTQSFTYNEGLSGQFIPEIGSSRKTAASGTAMGSGSISRLALHGNSLVASLYRPTLLWIKSSKALASIQDKIVGENKEWIQGLNTQGLDLFSAETDEYIDRVVSAGGMNSLIYKIPFGLVEVRRDPRQRVISIVYLEQCMLLGDQSGLSAGQFQIIEGMSFNFERKRPLKAMGPFSLSGDKMVGL